MSSTPRDQYLAVCAELQQCTKDLAAARALLREFVACAVNLENGEMFCKVETKVIEQTRALAGERKP